MRVHTRTRHPDLCHATSGVLTSQLPEHAKIGMRVKTLSDRRRKKILHVNTASGANWLRFRELEKIKLKKCSVYFYESICLI